MNKYADSSKSLKPNISRTRRIPVSNWKYVWGTLRDSHDDIDIIVKAVGATERKLVWAGDVTPRPNVLRTH